MITFILNTATVMEQTLLLFEGILWALGFFLDFEGKIH